MTTDDRELLGELMRLNNALGTFADGVFADSLSVTEQLDFSDQLTTVSARIRKRAERSLLIALDAAPGNTS